MLATVPLTDGKNPNVVFASGVAIVAGKDLGLAQAEKFHSASVALRVFPPELCQVNQTVPTNVHNGHQRHVRQALFGKNCYYQSENFPNKKEIVSNLLTAHCLPLSSASFISEASAIPSQKAPVLPGKNGPTTP